MNTIKSFFIGIIALAFASNVEAVDQKFAIAQIDNGSGIKIVYISEYKSANCRKLIETFYAGLKLDCPSCRIDYQSCNADVSVYRSAWNNEKFLSPYISHDINRYIISGTTRAEAERICEQWAQGIRNNGQKAQCVK